MNVFARAVFAFVVAASATMAFAAPAKPLPTDSVYPLPAPLTPGRPATRRWRTRRGRPQLVAMFYTSCHTSAR